MSSAVAEQEPARAAPAKGHALPGRRDDLVVRPVPGNQFVVKDPVTEAYFQLGEQEWFLLSQFDSQATTTTVLDAFQRQFDEALSIEDLDEFVDSGFRVFAPEGLVPLAEKLFFVAEGSGYNPHGNLINPKTEQIDISVLPGDGGFPQFFININPRHK